MPRKKQTKPTGKGPHPMPETIHIARVTEDGQQFFVADEGIEMFDDGQVVAVYTLSYLTTKRVRHELGS